MRHLDPIAMHCIVFDAMAMHIDGIDACMFFVWVWASYLSHLDPMAMHIDGIDACMFFVYVCASKYLSHLDPIAMHRIVFESLRSYGNAY